MIGRVVVSAVKRENTEGRQETSGLGDAGFNGITEGVTFKQKP